MNRKRTCTDLKIVVRLLESMSQAPIPEAGSDMRDPSNDVCYIAYCVSTPKVLPLSTWACPMRTMKAARRKPSGEPFAPRVRPGLGLGTALSWHLRREKNCGLPVKEFTPCIADPLQYTSWLLHRFRANYRSVQIARRLAREIRTHRVASKLPS